MNSEQIYKNYIEKYAINCRVILLRITKNLLLSVWIWSRLHKPESERTNRLSVASTGKLVNHQKSKTSKNSKAVTYWGNEAEPALERAWDHHLKKDSHCLESDTFRMSRIIYWKNPVHRFISGFYTLFLHERSFSIRCLTTGHKTFFQYELLWTKCVHFQLCKLITLISPHPCSKYCVSGQQTSRTTWFIIHFFLLDRLRCRLICMGASRQFCDLCTLPFNHIALIISASCQFLWPFTLVHSKIFTKTFPGVGIYGSQLKPATTLHKELRATEGCQDGEK